MKSNDENNHITIKLSDAEATVLLELLIRVNKEDSSISFEDQAEERVLWDLQASLEKVVNEAFKEDYLEILSKARSEVRDK
ncbi:MAG: hypothetical protein AAF363_00160 [Bacteroidota bacterium]